VTVWAGILGEKIIGPYFFPNENVNAKEYLDLLKMHIVPDIEQAAAEQLIAPDEIWFQQDGAAPHYATAVRNYLDATFPGRWIGRRGPIEWPARSPDLSPLDFYFWGKLKSRIYIPRPLVLRRLIDNVRTESAMVLPSELRRVQKEFYDRLGYCLTADGNHFEHMISTKKHHRHSSDSD
jgi:hypothetical protein